VNISIVTLLIVFILIAVRQVGNVKFQIWEIMLLGAAAVLVTGEISPRAALAAINVDVMLFLFGMFVVGQALEESGYLSHISYKYFRKANSVDVLILFILFGFGFASAFLMNDTLAIIGTPVVLLLARKHDMSPKLLLLALCFAVTTGSVMSPIGNPQNLLIAVNGEMRNPFGDFFRWLFIPTVINLLITFFFLKHYYRGDFHNAELSHSQERIRNHDLALLAKISLDIVLALVALKIILVELALPYDFRLTFIALVAMLPILIGSPQRWKILRSIDWHTLLFFAGMFVLMESVWKSGFFQRILQDLQVNIASMAVVLSVSIVLSQFISNVPLVALFQPMLMHTGASANELVALAAGSTIAGNLFILGAASNVIVIQNAEKRCRQTITFWDFARIGAPLTLIQAMVYWLAFKIV
jgi:Na+/H+ antiporter NhaD/arsenite permease-like protein